MKTLNESLLELLRKNRLPRRVERFTEQDIFNSKFGPPTPVDEILKQAKRGETKRK